MDLLKTTTHSAFPIVDTEYSTDDPEMPSFGRLRGLISRNDMISMIYMKLFVNLNDISRETPNNRINYHLCPTGDIPEQQSENKECFDKLNELYPRYPSVYDLKISTEDQGRYYLDFSLSMDVAPPRVSSGIGYPQVRFVYLVWREWINLYYNTKITKKLNFSIYI